jgi:hypothetical protein
MAKKNLRARLPRRNNSRLQLVPSQQITLVHTAPRTAGQAAIRRCHTDPDFRARVIAACSHETSR